MSIDKIPARYVRLKDNHSDLEKFYKLFDLAEELEITISFNSFGGPIVSVGDNEYQMVDSDNSDTNIGTFPYECEVYFIKDNPKYLQYQKDLEKKRQEEAAEKTRQATEAANKAYAARKEKERIAAEQEKIRIEKKEREELKRLKEKYNE